MILNLHWNKEGRTNNKVPTPNWNNETRMQTPEKARQIHSVGVWNDFAQLKTKTQMEIQKQRNAIQN
jgi:hypothetical protein